MKTTEKFTVDCGMLPHLTETLRSIGAEEENPIALTDIYYNCFKSQTRLKIRQINKMVYQCILSKEKIYTAISISADQLVGLKKILNASNGARLSVRIKRTHWRLENTAAITIDIVEGLEGFAFVGIETFLTDDDLAESIRERERIVGLLNIGTCKKVTVSYYDLLREKQDERKISSIVMESFRDVERAEQASDQKGKPMMSSGLRKLNNLTKGFKPSQLTLVTGEQSICKMAFVYQIALYAAAEQTHVGLVSTSLREKDIVKQMLCSMADNLSYEELLNGTLTGSQWVSLTSAVQKIYDLPLSLYFNKHIRIAGMLRMALSGMNMELLVVDNLETLALQAGWEYKKVLLFLKKIAKALDISLLVVSHLDPKEGLPETHLTTPDVIIDVSELPVQVMSQNADEKDIVIAVKKNINGSVSKVAGSFCFTNLRFSI